MRATLESIGKRQCELTKGNAQILDWAMKTVSGKKKVSLPKINISYCVPYIIVPQDVQDFVIPYSQLVEPQVIPFKPPVEPLKLRFIPSKPPGEPSKSLVEPKENEKQ